LIVSSPDFSCGLIHDISGSNLIYTAINLLKRGPKGLKLYQLANRDSNNGWAVYHSNAYYI
jgi:hypothetical protein